MMYGKDENLYLLIFGVRTVSLFPGVSVHLEHRTAPLCPKWVQPAYISAANGPVRYVYWQQPIDESKVSILYLNKATM